MHLIKIITIFGSVSWNKNDNLCVTFLHLIYILFLLSFYLLVSHLFSRYLQFHLSFSHFILPLDRNKLEQFLIESTQSESLTKTEDIHFVWIQRRREEKNAARTKYRDKNRRIRASNIQWSIISVWFNEFVKSNVKFMFILL